MRDATELVWVLNLAGGPYDSWWYDKTRPVTHRHILDRRDPESDWVDGWMLRATNAGLSPGGWTRHQMSRKLWQT
jgi:hypothetical protein